jgi:plastocyanin
MHPTNVASAAWVYAAAPSKVPFYVVGGALAAWAVLLAAFGVSHPDFPSSKGRSRFVMLASVLLVAGTITAAVLTGGGEGGKAKAKGPATGTAPVSSALVLTADPAGTLAYDVHQATVKAGADTIRLVNRSSVPHNVTIAKGTKVLAATKTIQGATTTAAATLPAGRYVFYCSVDAHRQGGMQGTLTVQ